MKILIIQLLRLGDIIMSSGVARAIKEENPGSELHMLINYQCRGVVELLPFVDRFFFFDRERVQNGLGDPEAPLLDSFDYLNSLIKDLNTQNYARVLNFSQNFLSARLLGLIVAREKIGMQIDELNQVAFNSEWFARLNTRKKAEPLHYIDYLTRASGVAARPARPLGGDFKNYKRSNQVVLQAFTSDDKKNWELSHFFDVVRWMHLWNAQLEFVFLAAPGEQHRLAKGIEGLKESGIPVQIKVCSLLEALQVINQAQILITGDTSIKHLASATSCPILELCLGSSDFRFTGAYSDKSYILHSNVACAPCSHREPCPLRKRICAETLDPMTVARMACRLIAGESLESFENLYQGKFLRNGLWVADSVQRRSNEDVFEETLRGVEGEL